MRDDQAEAAAGKLTPQAEDARDLRLCDIALMAGLFALAALLRALTLRQATDVDTGTWLREMQEMLRGAVLYRDLDANKPPLIFAIGAAALKAGGGSLLLARWVVIALTASVAPALYLAGRRLAGRPAGVAAGALYAIDLLSIWYGKFLHESMIVAVFGAWTICLLILTWHRRPAWALLPGAACGLTFAANQPGIVLLPAGLICLALRPRRPDRDGEAPLRYASRAGCYLLGFALALMPFAVYLAANGALGDAYDELVLLHLSRRAMAPEHFHYAAAAAKCARILSVADQNKLLWLAAAFFPAAFLLRPRREWLVPAVWLAGVAAFYALVYYSSSDHYLLQWIPPAALLAGLSAQFLIRSCRSAGPIPPGLRPPVVLAAFAVTGGVLAMVKVGRPDHAAFLGALALAMVFSVLFFQADRPRLRRAAWALAAPAAFLALLPYYLQRHESREPSLAEAQAIRMADHVRALPRKPGEGIILMAPGLAPLLPDVPLLPVVFGARLKIAPMGLVMLTERYAYEEHVMKDTLAHYDTLSIPYAVIYARYWHAIASQPHNRLLREFVEGRFRLREKLSLSDDYYGNVLIFEARDPGSR